MTNSIQKKKTFLFLKIIISSFYLFTLTSYSNTLIPEVKVKSKNISTYRKKDVALLQFNKAELNKIQAITITELLSQQQSIVRLTQGNTEQTAVSIRGFGDNAAANSLILVDGFPLIQPSLLAPNLNAIPLMDIERLDIFQGSEGSLWGNQAVGGVVNIITKKPQHFFYNMLVGLGSYNLNDYNILLGNRFNNNIYLKMFASLSHTANQRAHNQQKNNNFALQAGWDYARGNIQVNLQTYHNKSNLPGGLNEFQYYHHPHLATDFSTFTNFNTDLLQISNKHELNNQWLIETRLLRQITKGDGFSFLPFNRKDSLDRLSSRLIGDINHLKLISGYDFQTSDYFFHSFKEQETKALQHDIYAQVTLPLTEELQFTLGTRAALQNNKINKNNNTTIHNTQQVLVKEMGLNFKANDHLSFFARRDGNFRFAKANEQTWIPDHIDALKAQTGVSYEIGSHWTYGSANTQLRLYRLALNNEIAFNPNKTATQPFGAYNNLDETLREGVSLNQTFDITTYLRLNAQINYVYAKYTRGNNASKIIPWVPQFTSSMNTEYDFSDHWRLQHGITYTGTQFAAEDNSNIGKKIPAYWIQDLSLQYHQKSITFGFGVNNLFNELYPNYAYYNSLSGTNTYYPAPGRNYLFTIKVNLD